MYGSLRAAVTRSSEQGSGAARVCVAFKGDNKYNTWSKHTKKLVWVRVRSVEEWWACKKSGLCCLTHTHKTNTSTLVMHGVEGGGSEVRGGRKKLTKNKKTPKWEWGVKRAHQKKTRGGTNKKKQKKQTIDKKKKKKGHKKT